LLARKAFAAQRMSRKFAKAPVDIIMKVKRRDEICEILGPQDIIKSGKILKGGESSEKESII
jgi:hypothetical protein